MYNSGSGIDSSDSRLGSRLGAGILVEGCGRGSVVIGGVVPAVDDIRGQMDQTGPYSDGGFGDVTHACGVNPLHLGLAASTRVNGGSVDNGLRGERGNDTQDVITL